MTVGLTIVMLVTFLLIILWVIVEKRLLDKKTQDETKDDLFEKWPSLSKAIEEVIQEEKSK